MAFLFSLIVIVGSSSSLSNANYNGSSSNVPAGTTIHMTGCWALPGSSHEVWCDIHDRWEPELNPYRQFKVVFFGARYTDGQEVTDPACPIIATTYAEYEIPQLANFYYLDGQVAVYSRQSSAYAWTYAGYMLMSSSNCSMEGNKVMIFTFDCGYLIEGED